MGDGHVADERALLRLADAVDDLDEGHQNDNLNGERHEREERMVVLALEELGGLFANGIAVAVVCHFDAVALGHQRDHLEGVSLTPKRHRELQHLS